jgi:hypothetical protein
MRRIWLERNARTFDRKSTNMDQLVALANEDHRHWLLACAGRKLAGHGEK